MADRRYPFDGQMVTPAELSQRVTMFATSWLLKALRAGCQSVPELHEYDRQREARKRRGLDRGRQRTGRLYPNSWGNQLKD